ncbi:hypothetical protein Lesp01_81810 [Lentzea sp. NBRC 102530]|nr:hypothetical protein Lesp01_81810 [Lentzea sp. NBRC 102530]
MVNGLVHVLGLTVPGEPPSVTASLVNWSVTPPASFLVPLTNPLFVTFLTAGSALRALTKFLTRCVGSFGVDSVGFTTMRMSASVSRTRDSLSSGAIVHGMSGSNIRTGPMFLVLATFSDSGPL